MAEERATQLKVPAIPESERTALVDALVSLVLALREENAELRERVAGLEKNSTASSKPPS